MRLGFVLGFLIGGGIASFVARPREEQEHVLDEAASTASEAADATAARINPYVERIRHQVDEAKEAAREAQLEKEAEMQRMYDEMVHRKQTPGQ